MALYSVSTRSTLLRRLGAAIRAWWVSSGRSRLLEDDQPPRSEVTKRIPRRSLVLREYVDSEPTRRITRSHRPRHLAAD